jgi:DNA-binding NtrC family response regulator
MAPYEDEWDEHLILIVAAQPAASILQQQFARHGWSCVASGLCSEAEAALQVHNPAVVLTQDVLPDGTWREVFQSTISSRPEAVRFVCSRQSTLRLWMDVLAKGGCDLIPEPCPNKLIEHIFRRFGQTEAQVCDAA